MFKDSAKLAQLIRFETQTQAAYVLNETKSLLQQYSVNLVNLQRERAYLLARVQHYERNSAVSWADPLPQHFSRAQIILESFRDALEPSLADQEHITTCQALIPLLHREQAQGLLRNSKFQDWVVAPESKELLVHGNFEGVGHISGLSSLSVMFLRGMQGSPQFLTLVFFCGRHLEGEDAGGCVMIKSLITQLLRQYRFDTMHIDQYVNSILLERDDLRELTLLFRSLVLQLHNVTLICIVDGVKYYERDEHIDSMALVLRALLDLIDDDGVHTVFKILVTSPSPTSIVREAFAESNVVSLDPVLGVSQGYSQERLTRDLNKLL